jgi:uncharacterized membrane protein HdeD (DUF308 family)
MRKTRTGALIVGIIFGPINLFSFICETYEHRDHALKEMGIIDVVLLIAGPITLILATLLGLKHERFAGYWLITGGLITAALFAVWVARTPTNFLIALLVLIGPMLVEGWLWLKDARALHTQ